jgi:hypothetical protein
MWEKRPCKKEVAEWSWQVSSWIYKFYKEGKGSVLNVNGSTPDTLHMIHGYLNYEGFTCFGEFMKINQNTHTYIKALNEHSTEVYLKS